MATVSPQHNFIPMVKVEPINPVYEERPYLIGSSFLGFGSVETVYKKDLISCDGMKETWYCKACGKDKNDDIHNMFIRVDRP